MFDFFTRGIAANWLLYGRTAYTRWRRGNPINRPILRTDYLIPHTPEEVAKVLKSKITWTSDGWWGVSDWSQWPEVTLNSGKGDCDDFACAALLLFYHYLDEDKYANPTTLMVATKNIQSSHCYTLWQQDGKYGLISNGGYMGLYPTWEDVKRAIFNHIGPILFIVGVDLDFKVLFATD